MRLRHTAALALVGWYLMVPPGHPVSLFVRLWRGHFAAWNINASFDSAATCESARAILVAKAIAEAKKLPTAVVVLGDDPLPERDSLCVSTDDPRLKGN